MYKQAVAVLGLEIVRVCRLDFHDSSLLRIGKNHIERDSEQFCLIPEFLGRYRSELSSQVLENRIREAPVAQLKGVVPHAARGSQTIRQLP
jgi:hypothetical protein